MKSTFLILSVIIIPLLLFSQTNNESLIEKCKNKNIVFSIKINDETYKTREYLNLANENIISSKLIVARINEGSNTEDSDKDLANIFINKAKMYALKSDSVYKVIVLYKDSIKINEDLILKLSGKQVINPTVKDTPIK